MSESIADIYSLYTMCHIHDMQHEHLSPQKDSDRVYLDWAAATPLSDAARTAMEPFLTTAFANPSAIHHEGQVAGEAVRAARQRVARALSVRPAQVTFTSGGTEANNLAIFGLLQALKADGRPYAEQEVLTTATEHPSISEPLRFAAREFGITVRELPVTETGQLAPATLAEALSPRTVLLATAYVNSEIGTIQPVREFSRMLQAHRATVGAPPYLLLDAAQAPLWLPCAPERLGADLMTLDFAKCGGPKGSGALINRSPVPLCPWIFGGGQERALRPGTEAVPLIVGGSVALAEAQEAWEERQAAVATVRDSGITCVLSEVPGAVLNGPRAAARVANNINISLPGIDTEFAAVVLDARGYAVSTKSACSGAGGGASAVVLACTNDDARAAATLRVTIGPRNTATQLSGMASVLREHVAQMRRFDSQTE